jgi:hypothetical protein
MVQRLGKVLHKNLALAETMNIGDESFSLLYIWETPLGKRRSFAMNYMAAQRIVKLQCSIIFTSHISHSDRRYADISTLCLSSYAGLEPTRYLEGGIERNEPMSKKT